MLRVQPGASALGGMLTSLQAAASCGQLLFEQHRSPVSPRQPACNCR